MENNNAEQVELTEEELLAQLDEQHRQMVADENGVEYKDNDERAIF